MARTVATTAIHNSEIGISTFHPNRMNWSYRSRGSVPRSQMKTNMKTHSLAMNQITGHQPSFAPDQIGPPSGQGACQPPRNSVVANAATVNMLMYSARKNSANLSELYSVWNPPTSSPSASGRSNGARLVSPTIEVRYTRNDGSSTKMNQRPSWAATMPEVDMVPA